MIKETQQKLMNEIAIEEVALQHAKTMIANLKQHPDYFFNMFVAKGIINDERCMKDVLKDLERIKRKGQKTVRELKSKLIKEM